MKDSLTKFSLFQLIAFDKLLNFIMDLPMFKWLKIEINRYQVVNRTYAEFVALVVFVLPAGGIASYIERPDLIDVAFLQIIVGVFSILFFYIAKKFNTYLKFAFCMMLLSTIAYCFYSTGGIDGTLLFYWVESLILTWVVLSDNMTKVWTSTFIHFLVFGFWMFTSLFFPEMVRDIYPTREARIISCALHGTIIFSMLVMLMNKMTQFIKELKEIDGLTGIFKREHIEQVFAECQKLMSIEPGKRYVVALIDIDNFKSINDGNGGGDAGHAIGDEALVGLSAFILEKLRKSDYFGRYGGDELIAILSDVTLEEAGLILDRIRLEVSEEPFTSKNIRITLSIGAADILPDLKINAIIKKADTRMYAAKEKGKNRVVCSDGNETIKGDFSYA